MQLQEGRRDALLIQLAALKFLLRQSLALQGYKEVERNIHQFLLASVV